MIFWIPILVLFTLYTYKYSILKKIKQLVSFKENDIFEATKFPYENIFNRQISPFEDVFKKLRLKIFDGQELALAKKFNKTQRIIDLIIVITVISGILYGIYFELLKSVY